MLLSKHPVLLQTVIVRETLHKETYTPSCISQRIARLFNVHVLPARDDIIQLTKSSFSIAQFDQFHPVGIGPSNT